MVIRIYLLHQYMPSVYATAGLIKEILQSCGEGIMAERLVIICNGGRSRVNLINNQNITSSRLRKDSDITK